MKRKKGVIEVDNQSEDRHGAKYKDNELTLLCTGMTVEEKPLNLAIMEKIGKTEERLLVYQILLTA